MTVVPGGESLGAHFLWNFLVALVISTLKHLLYITVVTAVLGVEPLGAPRLLVRRFPFRCGFETYLGYRRGCYPSWGYTLGLLSFLGVMPGRIDFVRASFSFRL